MFCKKILVLLLLFLLICEVVFAGKQPAEPFEQHEQRPRWLQQLAHQQHGARHRTKDVGPKRSLSRFLGCEPSRRSCHSSSATAVYAATSHARPTDPDGGTGWVSQPSGTRTTSILLIVLIVFVFSSFQILNQPLAPQTLVLLNQLLQQIKNLHQLASQQCISGKPNNTVLQCSVLITKTKQQITNLQVRTKKRNFFHYYLVCC